MLPPTPLTDRFDRALLYAVHVHGGQARKGTCIPYIAHLLAVAATVLEYGGSETVAIAALLHDAAEDQGGLARLADIRNRFGDEVATIVSSCSDSLVPTSTGSAKEPWTVRKQRYIEHLRTATPEALLVSLADKVHNARSIVRDLRTVGVGEKVWDRFSRPKSDTVAHYRALATTFQTVLPGQLANELAELVDLLERA